MESLRKHTKKTLIGIVGGLVTIIGLILIPYPGPGWLVVFAGLAILSTEYVFAEKILTYAKHKYEAWTVWLKRQKWYVRVGVLCITGIVIVATLWLLNVLGSTAQFIGLDYGWLTSPLFRQ